MLPLARELEDRGWEVAVAASPSFEGSVTRRGLRFFPVGLPWLEAHAEDTFEELRTMSLADQAYWWVTAIFADRAAVPAARDLVRVLEGWGPDLVVRDYWEFGGWAAAEATGTPCAVVSFAMHSSAADQAAFIGEQLQAVRASVDLPPDPGLSTLYSDLYVDLVPERWQWQLPADRIPMRPVMAGDPGGGPPAPGSDDRDRPTVHVTLGTVYNRVPQVLETIVAGVAELDCDVVVTTGRNRDPAELGPLPANVRAERYVPHDELLPHCDAVVCHAGFGTTMAALAHDLPLVCVPLSADQPVHAARSDELGVGVQLRHSELTPSAVAQAVRRILTDDRITDRARRLGAEIRAMPDAPRAADQLEERLPL